MKHKCFSTCLTSCTQNISDRFNINEFWLICCLNDFGVLKIVAEIEYETACPTLPQPRVLIFFFRVEA